jgi:hypothetical protein
VDSFNKAPSRGGGFSCRVNFGVLLLPRRCGADKEEKAPNVTVVDFSWPRGRSMLLLGDLHVGAMASHRDIWPSGWSLYTPTMASSQPLIWRPFSRSAPTIFVLVSPTGLIPGSDEDGWRWNLWCGGGAKGPDRVFFIF